MERHISVSYEWVAYALEAHLNKDEITRLLSIETPLKPIFKADNANAIKV
jgi:hypothetical protein